MTGEQVDEFFRTDDCEPEAQATVDEFDEPPGCVMSKM